MKLLVIPDIHLKPWIIDNADEILSQKKADNAIFLGDFVDDWGKQNKLYLYEEIFDRLEAFLTKYPDSLICWGNHDVSYMWNRMETGFSPKAQPVVTKRMNQITYNFDSKRFAFVHRVDNCIFSHGGLAEKYVMKHVIGETEIDSVIHAINGLKDTSLWNDLSPLWLRPQYNILRPYNNRYLQVVGHTPVEKAICENGFLSLDTFSTNAYGKPIGDQKFVCIDTVSKEWKYVEDAT